MNWVEPMGDAFGPRACAFRVELPKGHLAPDGLRPLSQPWSLPKTVLVPSKVTAQARRLFSSLIGRRQRPAMQRFKGERGSGAVPTLRLVAARLALHNDNERNKKDAYPRDERNYAYWMRQAGGSDYRTPKSLYSRQRLDRTAIDLVFGRLSDIKNDASHDGFSAVPDAA